MTKADLYKLVEDDRRRFCVGLDGVPVNAIALSRQLGVHLRFVDFDTKGLRGVAYPDLKTTVLNGRLTPPQRNFYAAHELFHHLHHQDMRLASFQCYDATFMSDKYHEWEANEGAAELLLPYRSVLEWLGNLRGLNRYSIQRLQLSMANWFNVPVSTAYMRFNSLKYEIQQFMNGVSLDRIKIMSLSLQEHKGIRAASLNESAPKPQIVTRAITISADID